MITTLLFDMDGLIFDTESVYKKSWQYAAKEQGLNLSDAFYQNFLGVQDPQCEAMMQDHFGEALDLPRFRKVRDVHFHESREQGIDYKPGFAELFTVLKEKNLRCALVTSSHLPDVKHNFLGSNYLSQFDLVITAEDVDNGKPAPDCYLMACEKLSVQPSECLVLEDSNNGVRSGLAAGCQVTMIPDMLPPAEELVDKVILNGSLLDVIGLLES